MDAPTSSSPDAEAAVEGTASAHADRTPAESPDAAAATDVALAALHVQAIRHISRRRAIGLVLVLLLLQAWCYALAAWLAHFDALAVARFGLVPVALTALWAALRGLGAPWIVRGGGPEFTRRRALAAAAGGLAIGAMPVLAALCRLGFSLGWEQATPIAFVGWLAAALAALWYGGRLVARHTSAHAPRFWLGTAAEVAALSGLAAVGTAVLLGVALSVMRVPTQSMYPTLFGGGDAKLTAIADEANVLTDLLRAGSEALGIRGDVLVVDRLAYAFGAQPERWDVVVFEHTSAPEQALVKRLVGLPGDVVSLADGRVLIGGDVAVRPWPVVRAQLRPAWVWNPANPAEGLTLAGVKPPLSATATTPAAVFAPVTSTDSGGPTPPMAPGDPPVSGEPTPRVPAGTVALGVSAPMTALPLITREQIPPGDFVVRVIVESPGPAGELALGLDTASGLVSVRFSSAEVTATVQTPSGGVATARAAWDGFGAAGAPLTLVVRAVDGEVAVFVNRVALAMSAPVAGGVHDAIAGLGLGPVRLRARGRLAMRAFAVLCPTYYLPLGELAPGATLTVPADSGVVLGDYSANSTDSRLFKVTAVTLADGRLIHQGRATPLPEGFARQETVSWPFVRFARIRGRVLGVVLPLDFLRPIH